MPLSRKTSQKQRPAPAAKASVAASAGEQVRGIIEAAEATAAEIRADAEREAKTIVADARRELKKAKDEAAEATKVSDAATTLLERIEALGQEVDALRAGAGRLQADLSELQGSLSELEERPAAERPAAAEEPEPAVVVEPEPESAAASSDEDREGARLIALNMALNGDPREEVDRYLEENFDLADRDALLDEVYASVEG